MKTAEKLDTTAIVVQQPFVNLSTIGRTRVIQTGEFRLIDCHLNPNSNKAEISCFAGGGVRATVPAVHMQQLETWLGRVVAAEFSESGIDSEQPLAFLRMVPVSQAHNPLLTVRPGWIPKGHETDYLKLQCLLESLDTPYKELVFQCLRDDTILEPFLSHPASLGHHHNEVGGLLRHTVEVAADCAQACQTYKCANYSLAVTAALLHDIGKCLEYRREKGGRFSRSQVGELEMHKVQGANIVASAAMACGADAILVAEIVHCVTSTNGQDYMGLARPKMFETALVQTADARSSTADLYQKRSKFAFSFSRFGGTYADRSTQSAEPQKVAPNFSALARNTQSPASRPVQFQMLSSRGT